MLALLRKDVLKSLKVIHVAHLSSLRMLRAPPQESLVNAFNFSLKILFDQTAFSRPFPFGSPFEFFIVDGVGK